MGPSSREPRETSAGSWPDRAWRRAGALVMVAMSGCALSTAGAGPDLSVGGSTGAAGGDDVGGASSVGMGTGGTGGATGTGGLSAAGPGGASGEGAGGATPAGPGGAPTGAGGSPTEGTGGAGATDGGGGATGGGSPEGEGGATAGTGGASTGGGGSPAGGAPIGGPGPGGGGAPGGQGPGPMGGGAAGKNGQGVGGSALGGAGGQGGGGPAKCVFNGNKPGFSWGGHCYFELASASFDDARAACGGEQAHLVAFGSAAEEDAVASGIDALFGGSKDRWVGLIYGGNGSHTDPASWVWTDGEPMAYMHWADTDPNGDGPCGARRGLDGVWVDRACAGPYPPICERP